MPDWKQKRKVVLGITGGISAYKTPEIVRALVKSGCDVEAVLTSDGEKFVSPMVLSTLAANGSGDNPTSFPMTRGENTPYYAGGLG